MKPAPLERTLAERLIMTITFCVIALGTAIFFWTKFSTPTPPAQAKIDAYYRCVTQQTVNNNHGDVNLCNAIR